MQVACVHLAILRITIEMNEICLPLVLMIDVSISAEINFHQDSMTHHIIWRPHKNLKVYFFSGLCVKHFILQLRVIISAETCGYEIRINTDNDNNE